jgi:hypothetical protein
MTTNSYSLIAYYKPERAHGIHILFLIKPPLPKLKIQILACVKDEGSE